MRSLVPWLSVLLLGSWLSFPSNDSFSIDCAWSPAAGAVGQFSTLPTSLDFPSAYDRASVGAPDQAAVVSASKKGGFCSTKIGKPHQKCTATSKEAICSAIGDANRTCSTDSGPGAAGDTAKCSVERKQQAHCSVTGRSNSTASYCSSMQGGAGTSTKCSTLDSGVQNTCSILDNVGKTTNQCSANGAAGAAGSATCSATQPPAGSGAGENKCSVFGDGNANTGQCSTFNAGTTCSVKQGEQNVKCTALGRNGAGSCSTHPPGGGGGTQQCSVIGGPVQDQRTTCP